ncbi:response regulator [Endothiovibrio diazotrophicus]
MLEPISVLIVDDHRVVRAGFRYLLETVGGFRVAGEADGGAQCLRQYAECVPDVVLLDLMMEPMDGMETLHRLLARDDDANVLILSGRKEPMFAERALAEGASGYLCKCVTPELLIEAIRTVAGGGHFIDPEIAQEIALRHTRRQPENPFGHLSSREFNVFLQLARGRRYGDIASELCVSENTIATYAHRIRQKLGVDSRSELIKLALTHGLLDD